jgi:hypothetical protein
MTNHNRQSIEMEFESLPNIEPSAEWTDALLNKASALHAAPRKQKRNPGLYVALGLLVLLNLGVASFFLINRSQSNSPRAGELHAISQELLINPIGNEDN